MNTAGGTASVLHLLHLMRHCLDLILRARRFEHEFGFYQIQLQLQLAHCTTITANDMNRAATAIDGSDFAVRVQEATLSETISTIQETLRKAQQEAAQIRADLIVAAGGDLEACSTNAPLNLKSMRIRTTQFLDRRRTQAAKKIEALKWALYKKENCDKFIAEISAMLLHLERQVNVTRDARFLLVAIPWHLHEAAHEST